MARTELVAQIERIDRHVQLLRSEAEQHTATDDLMNGLAALRIAAAEVEAQKEEVRAMREELVALRTECDFQCSRYRELFAWVSRGCVATDADGTIEDANHAASRLLGAAQEDLYGESLPQFIRDDDRDRFIEWLDRIRRRDPQAVSLHGKFWCRSLSPRRDWRCLLLVQVVSDLQGSCQLIWSLQDLSERERARAADLLQAEVQRKNQFLALLGHELRNPLAAILLAAELLTGKGASRSQSRAAATVVRRQAEHIGRLVDDLLEVSRARYGKIVLRPERFDLRQEVAAAVDAGRPQLERNRHALVVELATEPVWVDGDPARLHQVIANLLDNAAKYTPPGGHVEVRLRRDAAKAILSVRDDGIGIANDRLESIFAVFEQAGTPEENLGGGLGLGLALVKQLVDLHGGRVHAQSAGAGCGSEFTIELPRAGPPPQPSERDAPLTRDVEGAHGARILVVDDNRDSAEVLGMTLQRLGYEPVLASSGSQAVERARSAVCSVALVDIGLPDISGFELARRLRAQSPAIVLVALTGFDNDRSRRMAERAGFRHYLLKPATVADIRRIVEDATGCG